MISKCKLSKSSNSSQTQPRAQRPFQLLIGVFLVNCLVDNDSKYFNEMLDLPIERFIYQYFLLDLTGHMEVRQYCQSLLVTQVTEIINLLKHQGAVTSLKHKYHHKHHSLYIDRPVRSYGNAHLQFLVVKTFRQQLSRLIQLMMIIKEIVFNLRICILTLLRVT